MLPTAALASSLLAAALVPSAHGSSLRQLLPTPHVCAIEHGFDYVGHDLANKPGPLDSCCDACYTTTGCKAWTWTDFNGGTCWLKWRRGEVVANKNAKSALTLVQLRDTCQVTPNLDYVGNDLARVDGARPEDCCRKCQDTLGCRAYSWSDFQGGSCWLKSKVTKVAFKAGVHSAEVYQLEHPQCRNVDRGVDYVGNDIGSARSSTPEGCCTVCETTPNCRAFSWNNYNEGTCWLKSRVGNVTQAEGVASSTIKSNPEDVCFFRGDTDYEGSDIGNAPGKDATQCCTICQDYDGCTFFTWSDYNGGTCWLKNRDNKVVAKKGVNSGYVRY